MKKFFKFVFSSLMGGIIGGLVAVSILFVFLAGFSAVLSRSVSSDGAPLAKIPSDVVLVLNLGNEIQELPSGSLLSQEGGRLSLHDLRKALEEASRDDKVSSLVLILPPYTQMGWATAKELKSALKDFADSGKKLVAYGEMVGEKALYVASVAQSIYMHPEGEFMWNGFAITPTFYKGLFDKIELKPVVFRAGKFKSAVEPYIQKAMSPANVQQMTELVEDLWEEAVEGVSAGRSISSEDLQSFSDSYSIRTAEQAYKAGLVDELILKTTLFESLLQKEDNITKKDLKRVMSLGSYATFQKDNLFESLGNSVFTKRVSGKNKIAVLVLEGAIMPGPSEEGVIGSSTVVSRLQKLRLDPKIKGVILRINSPGGSALASDVILREVEKLKETKEVFVSMADVAASGGYYIAAGASKIFAEANTITGSIGVFSVLFNAQKTLNNKLGLTFDRVATGPFADLGSGVRPMAEKEKEIFQSSVERIYQTFLKVVERGRKFTNLKDVDALAQGRVWSGNQAKEVGLVDEIGNLEDVGLALATELGLEEYEFDFYPKINPLDQLFARFNRLGGVVQSLVQMATSPKETLQQRLVEEAHTGPLMLAPMGWKVQ